MATELGLLSLTHLNNFTPQSNNQNQNQQQNQDCQLNPNTTLSSSSTNSTPTWMWNPKVNNIKQDSEDDSWEVRAFAEDTGNVMGTTWPPRSYTCAFCRREFRSAQALGGHMNVHRRDRARLHQVIPPSSSSSAATTATSSYLIPTAREFGGGNSLCLLYQYPNPSNSVNAAANFAACTAPPPPSTLLSISPYPAGSLVGPLNFPAGGDGWGRSIQPPEVVESVENGGGDDGEVDLELRLGHGPTPS